MNRIIRNLLIIASLLSAAPAFAGEEDELVDTIERVVPYDGVLDIDGQAYNGLLDVVFTLYDAADGGESVWTESWTAADGRAVSVAGGRFSVNLGTHEDIEGVIASSELVFLGLAVKRPEDANYTTLGGRQRLNPVPYSLWTTRATHLNVAGTANVGENLVVGGDVTSDQKIAADRFFIEGADDVEARLLSHDGDYLFMGTNDGSFGNGLRVQMPALFDNGVTHTGFLTANGGMSLAGGGLQMDDGNGFTGALRYADNYLRIGTTNRFGSGTLVETNLRTTGNADVDGTLNVDSTSRLRGNVTMNGTVSISRCRICINTATGGLNRTHTCVAMVHNQASGAATRSSVESGAFAAGDYSMIFLCDGGGTSSGRGNILANGQIQN